MNRLEALTQIRDGLNVLIELETAVPPTVPDPEPKPPEVDPKPDPKPEPDKSIQVKDTTELWALMKAAKGGEIFRLAPGAYQSLKILEFQYDSPVTVLAQGASFEEMMIRKARNVTVVGAELIAVYAKGSDAFKVLDSDNVVLSGLNVHGSLDGDVSNDTSAMQIRNSRNVSIDGSEFQQLANAVTHLDSDGVSFLGNLFHDIRMDGIRGGGTDNLLIEGNRFWGFRPQPADHGDAIQVWNSNTTKAARNIVIRKNLIDQADGGQVQGIFVTAQATKLRYDGVEISDNLVVGGLTNGITVSFADNVKITGNQVLATSSKVWIRMEGLKGLELVGNKSNEFYKTGEMSVSREADNTKSPVLTDGGKQAIKGFDLAVTKG